MQDLQIVLGAPAVVAAFAEPVVGDAKPRGREQVVPIGVVRESAGLAHQGINDMPVVHRVLVAADQPRERVDVPVGVPDFDAVGEQAGLDLFAHEATVHRVGVAMDVDQAARVDPAPHLQARRQAGRGQVAQRPPLLGDPTPTLGVPRRDELLQEGRVLRAAGEVAAAAEQQRLFDGGLEVPVCRLGVAVLVRLPGVDPLARQAVVRQEVAIAGLELARRRQVVDRGAQAIGTMSPGRAAQLPQRVLQAVGQRLERLRSAHRHRLPVRVGQHEVVGQVIERPAGDRDAQFVHRGEVGGRQVARLMDLPEDDGPARAVRGPPLPDAPLEGPAVRVEKLTRMRLPEPVEEGLGAEPWLAAKLFLDLGPNGGKRVRPRAIGPRFARLLAGARKRWLLAVVSGRLGTHASSPCRHGQGSP